MSALDKLVKRHSDKCWGDFMTYPESWDCDCGADAAAAELQALRARVASLEAAVAWALGYSDFPARQEGDPPYYWRKELRERAGLSDASARAALEQAG